MSLIRPPFPKVLDSSIMAAYRSCPRKAFLEYIQHWKVGEQSVHLHAGGAYAHGLEASRRAFYEQGLDPETCIATGIKALLEFYGDFDCPEDSAKSATRMAGALEFYFERYPLGEDDAIPLTFASGKRGIEFGFAEPIDELHPESGEPLIYCGRMDMIVSKEGMTLGEDDKTTSQLGASWSRSWDLRSQFTGYVWGAGKSGVELNGFLVRGVSILKSKYDTLEAITYRPDWQVARWYEQLMRDVRRMKANWEEGYWDYNLDHACAEYGGCPFRQVCLTQQPDQVLHGLYQRRRWDPITRLETVLPLEE